MYTITLDNNIQRINIIGPSHQYDPINHFEKNGVRVYSILSPEDEVKSCWGRIVYDVHKSQIFTTREAAQKEQFIRKLSSWD